MDFGDLVASAEQLTAEIDGSRSGDLPRVERSLRHILDAGQSLLGKSSGQGQDAKASILLGSRGVDLPAIASKIGSIQNTNIITETEKIQPTDIPAFLKAEREEAILSLLEETKKETVESVTARHWDAVAREWERNKAKILSAVAGGGGAGSDMSELSLARDMSSSFVTRSRDMSSTVAGREPGATLTTSSLSHHELLYARAVVTYNSSVASGGVKPDLLKLLASLFSEEREPEVWTLWEMVAALAPVGKERVSGEIISCAKKYLERSYIKFIRNVVYSNLSAAQLGGVPGTFHLVRSFLNIKMPSGGAGLDDGLVEGVPVWAMIYYCLRCGDVSAALQAATAAGPALQDCITLLRELSTSHDNKLSPAAESLVRLQYRRHSRQSADPYKRAVYCVLGATDINDEHPEVMTSLDDYLWLKLNLVREDGGGDSLTLAGLQSLMSEEYGQLLRNKFRFLFFSPLVATNIFLIYISKTTLQDFLLFQASLTSLPAPSQSCTSKFSSSPDCLRRGWTSSSGPGRVCPVTPPTWPSCCRSSASFTGPPTSRHLCSARRPRTEAAARDSTSPA